MKFSWKRFSIGFGILGVTGLAALIGIGIRTEAYGNQGAKYSHSGNVSANLCGMQDGKLAKMTGEETVYYYADNSGNLYRKSLDDDAWENIYHDETVNIYDINVDNIGGKYVYFGCEADSVDVKPFICRLNVETLKMERIVIDGEEPRLMDGKLYYLRETSDNRDVIWRMDLETLEEEIFFEPTESYSYIQNLSVAGENMVFLYKDSVVKLSPQGKLSKLYEGLNLTNLFVSSESIVFMELVTEYIIPVQEVDYEGNLIGTNEVDLPNVALIYAEDEYLYGFVYGINVDNRLVKIHKDSGDTEVILDYPDGMDLVFVNIIDETMLLEFNTSMDEGKLTDLYAMPADGIDLTLEDCVHLNQVFRD